MKKIILAIATIGLLATSCSRAFENKEIDYNANFKGFFKKNDADNKPVYDILSIRQITDDWDGEEVYSPNSGDEKLIRVLMYGKTTDYDEVLGFTEASFELYNMTDKKVYKPILSLKNGATFKGVDKKAKEGYVVYSIPSESDFSNFFIGLNRGMDEIEWENENEETLLALKKLDYDFTENEVAINVEKTIEEGWNGESVKYTFKSITYNCEDDNVKEFKKDDFNKGDIFARLNVELENLSEKEISLYTSVPNLISEYSVISREMSPSLPSFDDKIAPLEKKSQTVYYVITPGVKNLGIVNDGKYAIEFK